MKYTNKLSLRLFFDRWYAYGVLLLIHIVLAVTAFTPHFTAPGQTIFTGWGDGLKNNFTLYSYTKAPIRHGIFKYDMMNYPFGDYVYTTDNTPFFSIPFRWFCQHIYDISEYSIAIFNFVMIANIIFCGLLVFWVFRRLLKSTSIAWLLAIILPWTNFQLARLFRGHYNLSLTSFCLLALLLFLLWHKYYRHKTKRLILLLAMIAFSYAIFLTHGYYMAIIPVFLACMLCFMGIYQLVLKQKEGWSSLWAAVILFTGTALLAYATMIFTDGYFHLRPSFAAGYDWMEQKTNFSLLFSHYNFQHLYFPVWSTKNPNAIELMCYLGNIGLYALGILFIISLFSQRFRRLLWDIQKEYFKDPVKTGIFLSGLVLLSMSFGEHYYPLSQPSTTGWPFATNGRTPFAEWMYMAVFFALIVIFLCRSIYRHELIKYPVYRPLPGKAIIRRALYFYFSATLILYIMFGHYKIMYWVNVTNPLWLAHKFTKMVEQFRSLVRFAWPFYWSFYIWIGFTISALFLRVDKNGKALIICLILLLGGIETADFVMEIKHAANEENIFADKSLEKFKSLSIHWNNYQAILPIPFYLVGCETDNYNYTIDDIPEVSALSYQLSIFSGLPLMSGKLSRTPEKYNRLLMETMISDNPPKEVADKLNSKSVLIFVDKKYIQDSTVNIIPRQDNRQFARKAYWACQTIVSRNKLKPVDSLDNIYFYEWRIKQ